MRGCILKFGKAALFLITIVILILPLTACNAKKTAENKIKDIEFTVIGENEQPDALKEIISEKAKNPFQISYIIGGDLYIAIGYGEQKSGGFSITVNEFYETEDVLVIDTTLAGPGTAENVTDMPTTPYIVVKTENIADKQIEFK